MSYSVYWIGLRKVSWVRYHLEYLKNGDKQLVLSGGLWRN